jgi:acetate kinase
VGLRVARELKRPVTALQIISCHLGNGASVCVINRGFSIDTSIGMTPLEGLVMGTRSGDVDPGMFTYLVRELGLSIEEIEHQLYANSGLKELAGSHDLREVEQKAAEGDTNAQLAINVYAYRVCKYIGAYIPAMGGVDVFAFTGGIGENSASMRRRVCDKFEFLGLHLDDDKNQSIKLKGFEAPQAQSLDSRIVDVKLGNGERSVSFANTLIRAKEGYVIEMHIDTDEANAAGISFQTKGELVMNETSSEADIVAKKNMELNGKKTA